MFDPPRVLRSYVCPTVGAYWLLATWTTPENAPRGLGVPLPPSPRPTTAAHLRARPPGSAYSGRYRCTTMQSLMLTSARTTPAVIIHESGIPEVPVEMSTPPGEQEIST